LDSLACVPPCKGGHAVKGRRKIYRLSCLRARSVPYDNNHLRLLETLSLFPKRLSLEEKWSALEVEVWLTKRGPLVAQASGHI
jgi:hypothetical protein